MFNPSKKLTVKFSNGNLLTIEESGGYKIFNLIKPVPKVQVVNGFYTFACNMVHRIPLKTS